MTSSPLPDTEYLLDRIEHGHHDARGPLLQRHRSRLRRMVLLRLDPRLKRRIDPSDVVQETLAEADRRLSDYARRRPLPFYAWLRQMAWEKLVHLHRRHVRARKRSVLREEPSPIALPDESAAQLAERLAARCSSPSGRLRAAEEQERLHAALAQLAEADREVLVLRYLEDLSTKEIAAVLGLGESAVKMRQLRAIQRLRDILAEDTKEERS